VKKAELHDLIHRIEKVEKEVKQYEGKWLRSENVYIKFIKAVGFDYDISNDVVNIYYTSIELHKKMKYQWVIFTYSEEPSNEPFLLIELENYEQVEEEEVLELINKLVTEENDERLS